MSWIKKSSIKANVRANNWKEAVVAAGELLVENHFAEPGYVDGMVRTVEKLGPYIVIIPGVAMPHARPEYGVIDSGFALITLEEPVNFGNEDNDPVKVVIGFCAKNHDSHIESLRILSDKLSEEHFVENVSSAKDTETLIKFVLDEDIEAT